MSTIPVVERDERTQAVENASYRWAFLILCFGLLVDVAYRGFVRGEASWDLLALVIGAGGLGTLYQVAHRTLGRGWAGTVLLTAAVGAAVAAALAFLAK